MKMTAEQKCIITDLRNKGFSYTQIAEQAGISRNTIKSYCRRNNVKIEMERNKSDVLSCKQCGKKLEDMSGRKKPKFCSKECRTKWWNTHLEEVNKKAIYYFTCACCGKRFTAYGNKSRKYCSHNCYITARFGGGNDE